jgi:hypothetical protein
MNQVDTLGGAITDNLTLLGNRLIDFLPSFLGALIVFFAGWIIAVTFGKLVEKVIKMSRIDSALQKVGVGKIDHTGIHYSFSHIVGGLVKWFLVLSFLMAAMDILRLTQISSFLTDILKYIPNVLVAIIILAIVLLVGNFVYNIVKGSTRAAGVMSATLLATISKWSIILFGVFAALIQLGVAETLVSTIFIGIVSMLALAGGLAFGLGGKDEAAMLLRKLREELTENND